MLLPRHSSLPATRTAIDIPPRVAIGLVGLAALAAAGFGALLPENPLAAVALVAFVPLAFGAPVATLGVLLFVTVLVPIDLQNQLSFVGGVDIPGLLLIDVLLFFALCRIALLLALRKLRVSLPLALGIALALLLTVALVEGLALHNDVSEAGHEARRILHGAGAFIVAWPLLENQVSRRRLYGVLLALGLVLAAWGLAQWFLSFHLASAGDAGVRPGVEETSGGRGQLQGGLYAFPVAVTLSFAALLSHRVRSAGLRWLLAVILVANVVCLVLTFERTFWAATVAACLIAVVKSGRDVWGSAGKWALLGAVVLLVAMTALGQTQTAVQRLKSVAGYGSDPSLQHREVEARSVLHAIARRPLTGSGFGALHTWGKKDVFATWTTSYVHSGYLWLAWKLGIPVAALIVLATMLAALWRGPPVDDPGLAILRAGSQATLLGLLLLSVFWPPFNTLGVTAVMGVLVAFSLQPDAAARR